MTSLILMTWLSIAPVTPQQIEGRLACFEKGYAHPDCRIYCAQHPDDLEACVPRYQSNMTE